jgi:hypothetical protein
MSPIEPEFRVTISRGELRALGRAIESIERGLRRGEAAHPGDANGRDLSALPPESPTVASVPADAPPAPDGQRSAVPADPTRDAGSAQKRARIVAAFYESKGAATNAEIAKDVGANEGYVSRVLKPIREEFRAINRGELPRGRKGRDGAMEAWRA